MACRLPRAELCGWQGYQKIMTSLRAVAKRLELALIATGAVWSQAFACKVREQAGCVAGDCCMPLPLPHLVPARRPRHGGVRLGRCPALPRLARVVASVRPPPQPEL